MFQISLSPDKAELLKAGKPVDVRINGQTETLTLRTNDDGDCLCWRDKVRQVVHVASDSIGGESCVIYMCD